MQTLLRGRELLLLLYGGQLDQLWAQFGSSAQAQWGDLGTLAAYRAASPDTHWTEERLIREAVEQEDGATSYLRTVTYQDEPDTPWTVTFRLNPDGTVSRFQIVAADPQ